MPALVQTVLGPVPAADLGPTLVHEHLVPGTCEVAHFMQGRPPAGPAEVLAAQLRDVYAAGGRTVIDVTGNRQSYYRLLPEIGRAAGLHVIVSTAFYKEPHLPGFFATRDADWIGDFFERQIREGLDECGLKPGIIGEVGTSMAAIRPSEEKLLRAAARAQRRTGLAITTHTTVGTMGLEQLDIFEQEGAALDRVVIGHSDLNPDPDYHTEIARRGAYIGIDTVGKEHFRYIRFGTQSPAGYIEEEYYHQPDERRIELILELLHRGLGERILLSMDITAHEAGYNPDTFGRYGYSYLLNQFCARLRSRGVSQADLDLLLHHNPARLLGS